MTDASTFSPDFGAIGVAAPPWPAKRPIRIALLGDFGAGALRGRLDTGAALARRKPLKVEFDTLEDALARLELTLTLPVGADGAAVEVPITELESFHPDELYRNLEVFSALASLRKRLNTPASFAKAAAEVQAWGGDSLQKASAAAARARAHGAALNPGGRLDDFARLTGRRSAAAEADTAIDGLLRSIVGPFIVPASSPNKEALVAAVDAALSDAMRAVLHQPDFQNTESLWRGVDFLLRRLETSHQLQVHLVDIGAEEFAADLSSVQDLSQSGLYQLLVEQPSQEADGGYSYLVGCYHFEATPPQLELLGRAALVAAHAGASFLTAIDTAAFIDRKEPPHRLVRETFAALRESPMASFLGLLGPRFLLRHPYGKRSDPISSFAFEEFTAQAGLRGMLWGHPALLALCVLCVRGSQLAIGELPFHHFVDADGDSVALPCTERLINTNAGTLLRDYGINGLMAHKGEPMLRLTGVEAVNGDGLAAADGSSRKAPAPSRVEIGARRESSDSAAASWAPAQRAGGTAVVTGPAQALASEDEPAGTAQEEAVEPSSAEADAASATPAEAPANVDAELDALLASLDEPAAPAADAPAEEPAMDPELEALLKSLG